MTGDERYEWIYVVTDIEVDGPWPGPNSMRSFASVAVSLDGTEHGRFEAVLEELPAAAPNEQTLAWFRTIPEMWEAATADPEPVADVSPATVPSEWFGDVEHTHRAIDDALGYAHLLVTLGRMARGSRSSSSPA